MVRGRDSGERSPRPNTMQTVEMTDVSTATKCAISTSAVQSGPRSLRRHRKAWLSFERRRLRVLPSVPRSTSRLARVPKRSTPHAAPLQVQKGGDKQRRCGPLGCAHTREARRAMAGAPDLAV